MVSHEDEPTPIRYYQLFNNGIGIIIWTKLINVTGVDDVIWNGRYDQGGYRILIGTDAEDHHFDSGFNSSEPRTIPDS